MDTDTTRERVEADLGHSLSDWDWELLDEEGRLLDADSQDDPVQYLVAYIRETRSRFRPPRRASSDLTPPDRAVEAELRAAAYAAIADQDPRVVRFLTSHLPVGYERDAASAEAWLVLQLSALEGVGCPVDFLRRFVVHLPEDVIPVTVCSESLAALAEVSDALVASYGWSHGDAAGFVLTGSTPSAPLARGAFAPTSLSPRVQLDISTSLTQTEVGRAYEAVRSAAKNLSGPALGRPRRRAARNLAVALFVLRNGPGGWDQLREAWNGSQPKADRYAERRNFQRDANQGLSQVLPAAFRFSGGTVRHAPASKSERN